MECGIELRWGQLKLKTLTLPAPVELTPQKVSALLAGKAVPATMTVRQGRCEIRFESQVSLAAGQTLSLTLQ